MEIRTRIVCDCVLALTVAALAGCGRGAKTTNARLPRGQLVAGYSRNTPSLGLIVRMPDFDQAGTPLKDPRQADRSQPHERAEEPR